jgi:hypothetical protein
MTPDSRRDGAASEGDDPAEARPPMTDHRHNAFHAYVDADPTFHNAFSPHQTRLINVGSHDASVCHRSLIGWDPAANRVLKMRASCGGFPCRGANEVAMRARVAVGERTLARLAHPCGLPPPTHAVGLVLQVPIRAALNSRPTDPKSEASRKNRGRHVVQPDLLPELRPACPHQSSRRRRKSRG